ELRGRGRAGDVHAHFHAGVRDRACRGDIEQRVDVGRADEPDRAVAHQVEAASLEIIGAADRVDSAHRGDPPTGILADVQIAADGDVDVPERRAGRSGGPQIFAAQHQVV